MLEESLFKNILASLRVRRGWTQLDAVAHTGISRTAYIDLENANKSPSEKQLDLIATGFKLSQEDIDTLYRAARHDPPKIHNLPFHRNLLFTGRDTYFEDLDKHFKAGNSVAPTQPLSINGLGGIGKTQLALEYAYRRFPNVYQAVFWVNAADEETLLAGYGKLAQILELPERDEQTLDKLVEAVKQWLGRHRNWLLILDNADDLQLARSFFPEVHRGRILLTTRSQIVGNIATPIVIKQMPLSEGRLFLLRRSGVLRDKAKPDDVSADTPVSATQLVELLDGHPLALDQAGAYIEEGVSFTEYIKLYQEKRSDLLRRRGSLDSEYPASVAVTFELCFAKAREYHPLAIDILRFCAFLHPDDIPDELFQHVESFKSDTTAFIDVRTALLRYSLIKRNTQEESLSLHRLVQAVLIDDMSRDLQKQWRERVVRVLNAAFPDRVEFKNWRQNERLLSHALVCATWTEDELAPSIEVAHLLFRASWYLSERGQHAESEKHLSRVISIYEQYYRAGHPMTAALLIDLANVYSSLHKYSQAERLYQQAIAILEPQLGVEQNLDLAAALTNLAKLYLMQRNEEEAESHILRALSILKKQFGDNHPDTAFASSILAFIYYRQGKDDQAELLYRRSLRIMEKYLGAEDPDNSLPLYGLAAVMYRQRRYEQAEACFQRAISLQELQLGATHPHIQLNKQKFSKVRQNIECNAEAAALEVNDKPSL